MSNIQKNIFRLHKRYRIKSGLRFLVFLIKVYQTATGASGHAHSSVVAHRQTVAIMDKLVDFPAKKSLLPFPHFFFLWLHVGVIKWAWIKKKKKSEFTARQAKQQQREKSTGNEHAADSKMNFQEPFTASQDIRRLNSEGSPCL